jgi:hypothetical protein
MFGRGRPRGSHKISAAVLNTALQGRADQDTALDDERKDGSSVRSRTRTSQGAASLLTQPEDGSAKKADWPEDGHIEDADPDAGPTLSLSHTSTETSIPFGGPFLEPPGQTGMEGIVPQTPLADPDDIWSLRPRPAQPLLSQQPLLVRTPVSGIAHAAGLSPTQPICRLSLNPRQAVSPIRSASTGRMGTPPRSSIRPGHVSFGTPVTATIPNAQAAGPLTLNVSGIVAMQKITNTAVHK